MANRCLPRRWSGSARSKIARGESLSPAAISRDGQGCSPAASATPIIVPGKRPRFDETEKTQGQAWRVAEKQAYQATFQPSPPDSKLHFQSPPRTASSTKRAVRPRPLSPSGTQGSSNSASGDERGRKNRTRLRFSTTAGHPCDGPFARRRKMADYRCSWGPGKAKNARRIPIRQTQRGAQAHLKPRAVIDG